jgi:hypothetical protein
MEIEMRKGHRGTAVSNQKLALRGPAQDGHRGKGQNNVSIKPPKGGTGASSGNKNTSIPIQDRQS